MRPTIALALTAISAICLSSCDRIAASNADQPDINQADLCEVSQWRRPKVAEQCTPGQKIVFAPSTFGNEQLPVAFAAINCDLRYSVALTKGAVTCIYRPTTPNESDQGDNDGPSKQSDSKEQDDNASER